MPNTSRANGLTVWKKAAGIAATASTGQTTKTTGNNTIIKDNLGGTKGSYTAKTIKRCQTARNKINSFVDAHNKYLEAKEENKDDKQEEKTLLTELSYSDGKQPFISMKAKIAASAIQCLRCKKANYRLVTEAEMENSREEMKDGRTMDKKFDYAIRAEEAVWMEAEEAEQEQWEHALMEEEDKLCNNKPKNTDDAT
eukprot:7177122-Ditylum_brightwellii.AAC.1